MYYVVVSDGNLGELIIVTTVFSLFSYLIFQQILTVYRESWIN